MELYLLVNALVSFSCLVYSFLFYITNNPRNLIDAMPDLERIGFQTPAYNTKEIGLSLDYWLHPLIGAYVFKSFIV